MTTRVWNSSCRRFPRSPSVHVSDWLYCRLIARHKSRTTDSVLRLEPFAPRCPTKKVSSGYGVEALTVFSMATDACDLYTWGSGLRGMLGHKDEDDERVPRVVESLLGRDIVMAACGVAHTMALGGE